VYLVPANQRGVSNVERAGFRVKKYIFQMRMDVTADIAQPTWPEGITVRTVDLAQDAPTIHQIVQIAFALPGRAPQTYEEWYKFILRADIFQPDLWFLAIKDEEIIGVNLAFPYPDIGWVRQLAVLPEWQGRGVGAALLRQSFQAFKQRGYDEVGLTVESARPTSYDFYQRVGMKVAYQLNQYVKPIGDQT
jgi:ribosomal-protein-alanine N-acetyltransferase